VIVLIQKIRLKNFRCFDDQVFDFENNKFVIITGKNGSGKSSLLEALHYSCYLRSFRTHLNRDLVNLEQDYFFINIEFDLENLGTSDQLHVGFSDTDGKVVKLNQKQIQSYKELIAQYRIVSLSEDDLQVVSGAPEIRREFFDFALFLLNPDFLAQSRRYRQTLEQRNSMLANIYARNSSSFNDELKVWSQKLWEEALPIKEARKTYLAELEVLVNELLGRYFKEQETDLNVAFTYSSKNSPGETFEVFWEQHEAKSLVTELKWGRSLFGAHLDDFSISFQNKKAKIFASRGQQKLIIFLIKVAQLSMTLKHGEPGVFLLDDFLTDFDTGRLQNCLAVLQDLPFQIFITSPVDPQVFLRLQGLSKTISL